MKKIANGFINCKPIITILKVSEYNYAVLQGNLNKPKKVATYGHPFWTGFKIELDLSLGKDEYIEVWSDGKEVKKSFKTPAGAKYA